MNVAWFRTDRGVVRAPWRVAAFCVAVAGGSVAFVGILLPMVTATPVAEWARMARVPLDQVATVAALAVATWLTGRLVHGERESPWARAGLGSGAWRPAALAVAFAAGALVILLPSLGLVALGWARFEATSAADSALPAIWAALALLVPAAAAEELLFRGYAFDACVSGMGPRGAIVVTSAAFALAHVFNPDPSVTSLIAVACAGTFLAVVRLTTGSVVAATMAHLGVNCAQTMGLRATVSGLAIQTPGYRFVSSGPAWLTGGTWGPEGGAGTIVSLAAATFLYLRWRAARRESPGRAGESAHGQGQPPSMTST